MAGLLLLPDELLMMILASLQATDLAVCACLCQTLTVACQRTATRALEVLQSLLQCMQACSTSGVIIELYRWERARRDLVLWCQAEESHVSLEVQATL